METGKFNLIFRGLILIALSVLPHSTYCQVTDTSIVRTTVIDKSDILFLESSIGDIEVRTWDKNELKVEYIYSAEAKTEEDLKAFTRKLNIAIEEQKKSKTPGKIIASFPFNSISRNDRKVELTFKNDHKKYQLTELKCTLYVYMPKINPLNVKSNFNRLSIDNINADVTINAASVKLTMGDCKNLDINANFSNNMKIGNAENVKMDLNSCEVEMGTISTNLDLKSNFSHIGIEKIGNEAIVSLNSCSFETTDIKTLDLKGSFIRNFKVTNIEKAKINLNSSEFEAGKINNIDADKLAFTTFRIGEVENLKIGSSSSSTFTIDKAGSVETANSSFSNFTLNSLSKSFKSKSNSGNVQIKNILSGFDEINIIGTFVTIGIRAAENTDFQISADMVFPDYNFSKIFYQNHTKDMSHEIISGRRGNNQQATSKITLNCQSCKISID